MILPDHLSIKILILEKLKICNDDQYTIIEILIFQIQHDTGSYYQYTVLFLQICRKEK